MTPPPVDGPVAGPVLALMVGLMAGLLSLALTAAYLPLARRWQQVDTPNHRSSHEVPIPSSGGVAVIAALLLSCLVVPAWFSARDGWALCSVACLCLIGLVDDRRPLPVSLRLAAFLGLSLWMVVLYLPRDLSLLFLLPTLVLAFAWLINLYNFMDGIDGIAALQCALVAGSLALQLAISQADLPLLAAALAVAAVYGTFLVFNWPPARLFMGDAGSLCAGALLGWLGLRSVLEAGLSPLGWLLPMSPFIIDSGLTLLARAAAGERLTEAHRDHAYQRLAQRFGGHRPVDLGLLALQLLWLLPLTLLHLYGVLASVPAIGLALLPQLWVWYVSRRVTRA